jgi:plasmid stability protein
MTTMSRRDAQSFKIRGVPRPLLDQLDARALARGRSRNEELLELLRRYGAGEIAQVGEPPPFDPARRGREPAHGPDTASLAISGLPPDVLAAFRARARADGWLSKDDLIIALLRADASA